MKLKNKTILITGASRGIGYQTAYEVAKEGANVIINYNNSIKQAKELEQLLKKESVNMNSITDVLTYCQKREKRVFLIGGSIITILLIALIAFGFYSYEHRSFVYLLNANGENFDFSNSVFIKASNKYYLNTGKVVAKDSSIKTDDISIVSLKYNDELIVSSDDLNSKRLTENIGYNELFTKDKVNNIKDWYFEIEYKVDNETKKDILPVTIRNL